MDQNIEPVYGTTSGEKPVAEEPRLKFIILAFGIFAVFVLGLIWLFAYSPSSPIGAGWFLFSFAAGLSMIVLPCTLPLAFVIVPLAMGKGYKKGLGVALAFGAGVTITLSLYGLLTAIVGQFAIASLGFQLETVKNWLYVIAGIFVIVFAFTEIGLTKWRLPSYMGAAPAVIQRRGDYLKALLLGLFLGNVGIGCPSPATYILLSRIAVSGDIFYGWLLFFVHAIGRITPLIFLAILGIIGINATRYLVKHKDTLEKTMGWILIFVGGFILVLGLFTHDGWVYSGQHVLFEILTGEAFWISILSGQLGVEVPHAHGLPTGAGLFGLPYWLGPWVMVALWSISMFWYLRKQKKLAAEIADENQQTARVSYLRLLFWFFIALTLLFSTVFAYALPEWFVYHRSKLVEVHEEEKMLEVNVNIKPDKPLEVNTKVNLTIELKDEKNDPLINLEISHERILHVIIVSEDFSVFNHIHPEDSGPLSPETLEKAAFNVAYAFPKAGRYHLILDFKHEDHEISKMTFLDVPGKIQPIVILKDLSREKTFNGYRVALTSTPEKIVSGEEIHFKYQVEKDGKAVNDMEPYLGAPMHLAVFSLDFSYFLHTHGTLPSAGLPLKFIKSAFAHEEEPIKLPTRSALPSAFGSDIEAHITFPWPGLFVIFGEFKHQGKIIATSFMVEIAPGKNVQLEMPMHQDEH